MTEGVDALAFGPSAADLRAAGKGFMLGYLDRPDSGMHQADIAALHAGGIDVGLIAEWGAARMMGGAGAGTMDGQRAAAALKALGAPAGTAVYFAADWNATPAQMPAVDAYLQAAGAVLGKASVGVYGGLAVIRHVQASRSAAWLWQTYAWSGTPTVWAPGTHLQQYQNGQALAGHTVDYDRAGTGSWGQWPAHPAPQGHTIHIAAGALVMTATVAPSGCIASWTERRWGSRPSKAPCREPVLKDGCHSGSAQVAYVTRGAFSGRWVRVGPGVTVTSP